jgi:hypothetical protein
MDVNAQQTIGPASGCLTNTALRNWATTQLENNAIRVNTMLQSSSLVRYFTRAAVAAIPALIFAPAPAVANADITALFDPSAGISAADQATIDSAIAFYNTYLTSNIALTIDFGTQTGGGATSIKDVYGSLSYADYYAGLATNAAATGNAVQTSAVASLPNQANNPVTGTGGVSMTTTLAALYGLGPQTSESWSACGNLVGTACIDIGQPDLGTPSLLGEVQHEINEVLGTSSALSTSGLPNPDNPSAADLFRYNAPGLRGFAINTSTDEPCTGTPTAYFSVNGGTTNLNNYNNCNNGGDYGDWGGNAGGPQVQDAFGGPTDFTSMALAWNSTPKVRLTRRAARAGVSPSGHVRSSQFPVRVNSPLRV